MSLLECMYCKHRSYLFCCNKQEETIATICQACLYEFPINAHQNCTNCSKPFIRDIIYLQNLRQREAAMVKFREPQPAIQNATLQDRRNYLPNYQNQRANWQKNSLESQFQDRNFFKPLNQGKQNSSFPISNSQTSQHNRNSFGFGSEDMQLTAKQIQAANEVLNFPMDNLTRLNRERTKRGETCVGRNTNFMNDYESSIYDDSDGHTISDLNR